MKRLSNYYLPYLLLVALPECSQSTEVVDATYEIYIAGYDWGCGVNKNYFDIRQSC